MLTVVAIVEKYDPVKAILVIVTGSLIIGIGGGFMVCLILPLPLQLIIDLSRSICIKMGLIKPKPEVTHLQQEDREKEI